MSKKKTTTLEKLHILINYLSKVKGKLLISFILLFVLTMTSILFSDIFIAKYMAYRTGLKYNSKRILCPKIQPISKSFISHHFPESSCIDFSPTSNIISKMTKENNPFYLGKIIEYQVNYFDYVIINEGDFYKIPSEVNNLYNLLVVVFYYSNNEIQCDSMMGYWMEYHTKCPFNDTIIYYESVSLNLKQIDSILYNWFPRFPEVN